jgi:hypothetical protein
MFILAGSPAISCGQPIVEAGFEALVRPDAHRMCSAGANGPAPLPPCPLGPAMCPE